MELPQRNKPACLRDDAVAVVRRLREAEHIAYFAGGCVRDELLGLAAADYDVATDAPPDVVRGMFSRTQAVGAAFGVVLVRVGESVIEVATFRSDGKYSDGRRPDSVRFTTAEEDAQRRDFTINGLFFDPIESRLIDYVGGREDLAARRLRAIGAAQKRFEEDHLRLLRAVRFAARFDLEIDAATAAAIREAAPQLKAISPERIAAELRLMLTPVTRGRAWELLWDLKLGGVIFRMVALRDEKEKDPHPSPLPEYRERGKEERSIFPAVSSGEAIEFGLALAAAVVEVLESPDRRELFEKAEVRRLVNAMRKTLKISNEESDAMDGTLAGLAPLLADEAPRLAVKKRFLARPTANLSRRLILALAKTGAMADRIAALEDEFKQLEKAEFAPLPLITGEDLTAAHFMPGPQFKRILDSVYDAQLEGRISSRDQAMDLAGKLKTEN